MGKKLVIAEKPSVGRDIAAALGGFTDEGEHLESEDFVVTWAVGHLLELAEPKDYDKKLRSWSIKLLPILPEEYQIKPRDGQKKRLALIKRLGKRKDVDGIINACDAGREGEMIYRRVAEFCLLDKKPGFRLWLQSMTAAAIREAFQNLLPAEDLERLADAAWLRSIGDWLVGMNATRALTQRLKSRGEREAWSAGRVQTPTLTLLVQRERQILAHVPRTYWEIAARYHHGEHEWEARYYDPSLRGAAERDVKPPRIFDRAHVDAVVAAVSSQPTGVAREKRKKQNQKPPLLFDLTSLQREANRRFHFSARRTLDAAQRLYEAHKLLTYPRTDAKHLPDDYEAKVLEVLLAFKGLQPYAPHAQQILTAGLQNKQLLLDSSKVSDHFAIIPTGALPPVDLSGDDAKIFELVTRRFLAAWMPPAVWATVERFVAHPLGDGEVLFRATARHLEVPGFMAAIGTAAATDTSLPALVPGQNATSGVVVDRLDLAEEEKETRPIPRYNEAQLLRMMETAGKLVDDEELSDAMGSRGLGTPATRADTIEGLIRKSYARRVDGRLAPTSKAMRLLDILERVPVDGLASPALTGEWEHALGQVQRGELPRAQMRERIEQYTRDIVDQVRGFEHDTLYESEPDLGACPSCKEGRVVETAWGYRCNRNVQGDDTCTYIIWKDRFGRYIDRNLAAQLVEHGRVGPIGGFVDRFGRSHEGILYVEHDEETGKWKLLTEFGDPPADEEPEEVIGVLCVDPDDPESRIVETTRRYVSERLLNGDVKKAPVLPRVVCHRDITSEEAEQFFSGDGRTPMLEGFISRRGRPFKGALVRKTTGKHGFEFPARAPRKKPAAGAAAKKKKAPARKRKTATRTPATPPATPDSE